MIIHTHSREDALTTEPDDVRLLVDARGNIVDSWIGDENTGGAQSLAGVVDAATFDRLDQLATDEAVKASFVEIGLALTEVSKALEALASTPMRGS